MGRTCSAHSSLHRAEDPDAWAPSLSELRRWHEFGNPLNRSCICQESRREGCISTQTYCVKGDAASSIHVLSDVQSVHQDPSSTLWNYRLPSLLQEIKGLRPGVGCLPATDLQALKTMKIKDHCDDLLPIHQYCSKQVLSDEKQVDLGQSMKISKHGLESVHISHCLAWTGSEATVTNQLDYASHTQIGLKWTHLTNEFHYIGETVYEEIVISLPWVRSGANGKSTAKHVNNLKKSALPRR